MYLRGSGRGRPVVVFEVLQFDELPRRVSSVGRALDL